MDAPDLFPETKAPRRPRKLMHVIDAGDSGCCGANGDAISVVRFACHRCHAETGWLKMVSLTEAKRGIPCEACNA